MRYHSVNTHSNTVFSRDFTTDLKNFVQPGTGVLHRWGCASAHLLGIWPEMNWVNWDGSRLNQSLTLQCNPCASDQLSTAKLELCFSDKGPRNALKPANSLVHFIRLDLQNTETTDGTGIKVNWVHKLKPTDIAWEGKNVACFNQKKGKHTEKYYCYELCFTPPTHSLVQLKEKRIARERAKTYP